jgi:hypothetical protein
MNKERIEDILQVYRPGEGLESDPEVKQALELASKDPELAELRRQAEAFDTAFGEKLRQVEIPDSLYESIIQKGRPLISGAEPEPSPSSKVIRWFHPAIFAVAASIMILLALTFTFLRQPGQDAARLANAEGVMPTANALYASLNPSFKSNNGSEILNYLKAHNATLPTSMPQGFAWDRTVACDIIELDGKTVSVICFHPEDNSGMLHLFTFKRSDFPGERCGKVPEIHSSEKGASATWAKDDNIHVLFSENGDENLHKVLDI